MKAFLTIAIVALITCATARADSVSQIVLTPENSVILNQDINPLSLADVAGQVEAKSVKYLVIHSHGGSPEPIRMFARQVSLKKDLKVIVLFAASAAAAITQLVDLPVYIVPNGQLMFHRAKTMYMDFAELFEWERRLESMRELDDAFTKSCLNRMRITRSQYDQKTIGKNWFLDARASVYWNAVDKIQSVRCSPTLAKKGVTVGVYDPLSNGIDQMNLCSVLENRKISF